MTTWYIEAKYEGRGWIKVEAASEEEAIEAAQELLEEGVELEDCDDEIDELLAHTEKPQ